MLRDALLRVTSPPPPSSRNPLLSPQNPLLSPRNRGTQLTPNTHIPTCNDTNKQSQLILDLASAEDEMPTMGDEVTLEFSMNLALLEEAMESDFQAAQQESTFPSDEEIDDYEINDDEIDIIEDKPSPPRDEIESGGFQAAQRRQYPILLQPDDTLTLNGSQFTRVSSSTHALQLDDELNQGKVATRTSAPHASAAPFDTLTFNESQITRVNSSTHASQPVDKSCQNESSISTTSAPHASAGPDDADPTLPLAWKKIEGVKVKVMYGGLATFRQDIMKLTNKGIEKKNTFPFPRPKQKQQRDKAPVFPHRFRHSALDLVKQHNSPTTLNGLQRLFFSTENPSQDWNKLCTTTVQRQVDVAGIILADTPIHKVGKARIQSPCDLTKAAKIYFTLHGGKAGLVEIEVRNCREIKLSGLVALTCNIAMIEPDVDLTISNLRASELPRPKQFLKAILDHANDTWVSFSEAKAITSTCGITDADLDTIWSFEIPTIVQSNYINSNNYFTCSYCNGPILRTPRYVQMHTCEKKYLALYKPSKKGFLNMVLAIRECRYCCLVFWDLEDWSKHMERH